MYKNSAHLDGRGEGEQTRRDVMRAVAAWLLSGKRALKALTGFAATASFRHQVR
jgi:hypothetical protein